MSGAFVARCGAVIRSHDSSRQWTFELVEEYGECEEQEAQQKSRRAVGVNWDRRLKILVKSASPQPLRTHEERSLA